MDISVKKLIYGQLWFIPTDVSSAVDIANIVPQISVGLRVNVF